jgi:hypothetical protein
MDSHQDNNSTGASPLSAENPPATKKARIQEESSGQNKGFNSSTLRLPAELQGVDFSRRITWGKYDPYPVSSSENDTKESSAPRKIPTVPLDAPPTFTEKSPALCHQVHAICKRARACTIHLQPQKGQTKKNPRPVQTPIFMPVGTKVNYRIINSRVCWLVIFEFFLYLIEQIQCILTF